jgi:hypothetical protein
MRTVIVLIGMAFASCGEETAPSGCAGRDSQGNITLCQPEAGFQLATPAFEVPQGSEIQDCYFFEVPDPGTDSVYVNHIEVTQNDGTHHMNLFRVNTVAGLDGEPGDVVRGEDLGEDGLAPGECWRSGNWADWPLVINSQESRQGTVNPDDPASAGTFDWTLPAGVAHRFAPGEKLMLQTHYVNSDIGAQTTGNGFGKVAVNFHTVDEADVEHELGTAFATNQSICVCPGEADKRFEATCQLSRPSDADITIVAANGHFHSRGDRFDMFTYDSMGEPAADPFYTSTYWDDPPMERDLAIAVPPGGGVQYECTYSVEDGECGTETQHMAAACSGAAKPDCGCFTFGGKVEHQEHCNIFVYYYPKFRDVGCF